MANPQPNFKVKANTSTRRVKIGGGNDSKARLITAVQTCRGKVLGLAEDEAWRDFLAATVGERSCRAMTDKQLGLVLDKLRKMGAPPAENRRYENPQARLAHSLWIQLGKLGVLRNRSNGALDKYCEKQCGISSLHWVTDPQDFDKLIEALKSWLYREQSQLGVPIGHK
ncbi:MAG: regulatory protein GemA [Alphaproteobacteria bacterium]|nr:regulatory protein GemA [Alphaproteobacteria bacterium]